MNLTAQKLVVGSNGEPVGHVTGISMSLSTNQVCDLIVASLDASITMEIPVLSVVKIGEGEVDISIPAERCRDLASMSVELASHSGGTAQSRDKVYTHLAFGSAVRCSDGLAGRLRRVIYDQYSYDILGLVVGGKDLPHEVAVPIDWAARIDDDRIILSCQRDDLKTMPEAPEDR